MRGLIVQRSASVAAILFAAACGGAPGRGAGLAPGDALRIDGTATLDEMEPAGLEHFEIDLHLFNPGGIRRLTRAEVILASDGGWSFALGDPIERRGSLFGIGPEIAAGKDHRAHLSYWWSAPISLFLIRVDSLDERGAPQSSMVEIPIARPGFAPPARLPVDIDGFVSLQGPAEIVPMSNGKRWLAITGQIVNVSGRPITLTRWRVAVKDEGGAPILDEDLGSSFRIVDSAAVVVPFLYGVDVPAGVHGGAITLDAAVAVAGQRGAPRSLGRDVAFAEATPMRVSSPVAGTWIWKNGPGEPTPHTHTPWPEQRYAYDLSILRGDTGHRSSFDGDAAKNESFYAWDQPIRAAADGTVVEVVDDVPDNFGRTQNPANASRRNARVVIGHGDDRYTIYAHLRQGSAVVKVGQHVAAGDPLGRVGNAGFSTEPHLHFACFRIDATGRVRALPMELKALRTLSGEEVKGVPVGGEQYVSE